MDRKVEDVLIELGISPKLAGFDYICSAVRHINNNKGKQKRVCKIYELVAEEIGTKPDRIEKCIRHAFSKVNTKSETYQKYIGIRETTNSALLYTLAMRLKKD